MKVSATITRVRQETPTVKSFAFDLSDAAFSFLPGQWVDLHINIGSSIQVGGFSITSSPNQKGSIELAVKKIPSGVPSVYLHERAKIGDSFTMEGGFGDFYYQREMGETLVLIAGGIGITPLISILRYVDETLPDVEATLLYSVRSPSELIFSQSLRAMAARNPRIQCVFTTTQPHKEPWSGHTGRIDRAMLEEHMPKGKALFYVCGPLLMMEDVSDLLASLGADRPRIKVERW